MKDNRLEQWLKGMVLAIESSDLINYHTCRRIFYEELAFEVLRLERARVPFEDIRNFHQVYLDKARRIIYK